MHSIFGPPNETGRSRSPTEAAGPAASRGWLRVARPAGSAQSASVWGVERLHMPEENLQIAAFETIEPAIGLQPVRPACTRRRAIGWYRTRETACRHWTTPSALRGCLPPAGHTKDDGAARSRLLAPFRLSDVAGGIWPDLVGIFRARACADCRRTDNWRTLPSRRASTWCLAARSRHALAQVSRTWTSAAQRAKQRD